MEIPAYIVQATKNADGTVLFQIYQGKTTGSEMLAYAFTMATADVTAMNTTVNGGAAGTTASYLYAQSNPLDGSVNYSNPA